MRLLRIGVVVLLAWAGLPCLAQSSALEPPDMGRYVRWGPFRVRPGIELRNLGRDDNVFSTTTDQEADLTATVSPKLDGLVLFGSRAFATFSEKLEHTFYQDYSDQDFTNQRGEARVTLPLRRMGFFVEGELNRLKQRPVDQQDVRADRDENGLGLGVILLPGWRTEVELAHGFRELDFFDADAPPGQSMTIGQRLDRTENRNTMIVRYRILGRTRLTLHADLDTIEFASPLSRGRDSVGWGLAPGVDFGEGGRLSGSARIGWERLDADDPAFGDLEEVVGRAAIAYRPNSRTILSFDGAREPNFAFGTTSNFLVHTRGRLRAVYYLNRLIGLEAGGSRGKLTFPDSSGGFERVDRTDGYEAGVRLRLSESAVGRRVEYSLRLQRSRTDSKDDLQDRSRTVFGLNAVVGF